MARQKTRTHVPDEEFELAVTQFSELSCKIPFVPTPEKEVRLMEQLLGLEVGALENKGFEVKGDKLDCENCGRLMNWLDICMTALKVHPKAMLADALTDKYGKVITSAVDFQVITCAACHNQVKTRATQYKCKAYSCIK